ncbi:hypothetical protein C8J55DRAFT_486506 [Lentinula edodes]|uniref:Uncharacterized protein n=1 Tax=Lentinula lateritia TaxID=40482 RepID=A0A9W9AY50_9AGAR|nr:hypothetical protein C8J55DRAFT_486502 [Lentinula edodes]KAJ4491576.1 hypothetical protein C8J55DRAFT_486506 [Lentinula edodes]
MGKRHKHQSWTFVLLRVARLGVGVVVVMKDGGAAQAPKTVLCAAAKLSFALEFVFGNYRNLVCQFRFALEGAVQLNGFRDAGPNARLQPSAVRTLPEALKHRRTSRIKLFKGRGLTVPGSESRLVWDFVAIETEIEFDSFSSKLTGVVARTTAQKMAAVALFVGIAWTAPKCMVEKADVGKEVAEENGRCSRWGAKRVVDNGGGVRRRGEGS